MKLAPLLAVAALISSSCAPKAILISASGKLTEQAVAEKKTEESPGSDELPNFKPNDGLLDPSSLTAMPSDRDMKSTVGPSNGDQSTVIANPPDKEKATNE